MHPEGVGGGGSSHWDSAEKRERENWDHCAPQAVSGVSSSPALQRLCAVMDLDK